MRRKKANSRFDRNEWAPLFSALGISLENALQMNSTDFENKCDYLESIGINPKNPPTKKSDEEIESEIMNDIRKRKNRGDFVRQQRFNENGQHSNNTNNSLNNFGASNNSNSLSKTSELRFQQDEEYQKALKEEQEKEEKLLLEQNQLNSNPVSPDQLQENSTIEPTNQNIVGPEPENGIQLLIKMPSGQRITRIFEPSTVGNIVYLYVKNTPELLNLNLNHEREIILTDSFGNICDKSLSLEEQNIQNRTFFIVSFQQT